MNLRTAWNGQNGNYMMLNKNRRWNRKVMAIFAILFALTPLLVLFPSQVALAADGFAWVDKNTIVDTSGSSKTTYTYKTTSGGQREFDAPAISSSTDCSGPLTLNVGSDVTQGNWSHPSRINTGSGGTQCGQTSSSVSIGNKAGAAQNPSPTGPTGSSNPDNGSDPGCESGSATLGWLLCPLIEGIAKAADGIYGNFIQPMLTTNPLSLSPSNAEFKAWSEFRVLGDIFLVLAVLIIVFSETIGGGMLDAYTIKKVIPRLLIAVVAINLSYYIVAFAVDVTNILGNGIISLIEDPFKNAGTFHLKLTAGGTDVLGVSAAVTAAYSVISFGPFISWLWVFVLVPLILTMVAILVTVIVRAGAIIFLVIVSPVAFALYCLPNTEQYFRKWWDLLFRTLLVYPIIAALFGIANVLATTIGASGLGGGGLSGAAASVVAVFALVMPLFLIPFSFRMAGGAIGKFHEAAHAFGKRGHEAYKGNINDQNSRQNRARQKLAARNVLNRSRGLSAVSGMQKTQAGDQMTAKQARRRRMVGKALMPLAGVDSIARMQNAQEGDKMTEEQARRQRILGKAFTPVGMALGAGDLEYQHSMLNKQEAEKRELKTNFGPDSSVRALFAKKQADGTYRSTTNGQVFSALEYQKAQQLYGKGAGQHATQTALDYELGKAGNTELEYEHYKQNAATQLASMGYNESEINGIMKGVGFKNAGKYLDLKHSSWSQNKETGAWEQTVNQQALAQDVATNFGNYPVSNMKDVVPRQLGIGFDKATGAIDRAQGITNGAARAQIFKDAGFKDTKDSQGNVERTAEEWAHSTVNDTYKTVESFQGNMRSGRGTVGEEGGDEHVPVGGVGTGAAGRTHDEIVQLISKVNTHKATHTGGRSYGGGTGPTGTPSGPGSPSGGMPSGGSGGRGPRPPQPSPWTPPNHSGGNPSNPSSTPPPAGGPTPPRISLPGDDDFNIPPGSLPPGR